MKKYRFYALLFALVLTGCSGGPEGEAPARREEVRENSGEDIVSPQEEMPDKALEAGEETEDTKIPAPGREELQPEILETDWSEYFDGLNGAVVLYDEARGQYRIYNGELARTQRSPCSTFKIISSLIALEEGVLKPEDSTRAWSGETFWNDDWNRDLDFEQAFRASCVWYFREVVDETGQEAMQAEIERLKYGNCDISDWEGRLNTNNNNRALTGFWIESSLKISPMGQAEVMARIFGDTSPYGRENLEELKRVMLTEQDNPEISVYGKTGMGKVQGVTIDAWFTGFAQNPERKVYFCVYLGETEDEEATSATAREIAVRILGDCF